MRTRIAAMVLAGFCSPAAAQVTPAPELCVIDPTEAALGVSLTESTKQPIGDFLNVTCTYLKSSGTAPPKNPLELAFGAKCPANMHLAQPGYALYPNAAFDYVISGFAPAIDSNGLQATRVTVITKNPALNLGLIVIALCQK